MTRNLNHPAALLHVWNEREGHHTTSQSRSQFTVSQNVFCKTTCRPSTNITPSPVYIANLILLSLLAYSESKPRCGSDNESKVLTVIGYESILNGRTLFLIWMVHEWGELNWTGNSVDKVYFFFETISEKGEYPNANNMREYHLLLHLIWDIDRPCCSSWVYPNSLLIVLGILFFFQRRAN